MKRNRIRNTSGVSSRASRALSEETGADAFLITSFEIFSESLPPKVSLFSRLVLSGERSEIIWMDSVGLSGDGSVGLLDLGRVYEPHILLERVVHCLAASLARTLPETTSADRPISANGSHECDPEARLVSLSEPEPAQARFEPRAFFRSETIDSRHRHSVAVIPFLNLSGRKNAGKIMALHFLKQLFRNDYITVVEPGLVREQLLKHRIIMEEGPSLDNAETISSQDALGVDLVFSGTTFDYQDTVGTPKVDFSVQIIERKTREVIYFFDYRRIYSAHRLASEMAKATSDVLTR
jgi:hypothetical protein